MSVDLGALGRTVFREAIGAQPLPSHQASVSIITKNLEELERQGMTSEGITVLQKGIVAFSEVVHLLRLVLVGERKILNLTRQISGDSPATFAEFIKLSKFSVVIRDLATHEATFIDRMHGHLYSLIDKDIDELAQSDELLDKMKTITQNFNLLTSFLNTLNKSMSKKLKEVETLIAQDGPATHIGHLKVDVAAAAARLIALYEEHNELSAKYSAVSRLS